MAFDAFTVVKFVHVLGAAALVGYFAVLPMLRPRLQRAQDPGIVREGLALIRDLDVRLALPSAVLLLATGLAMVVGPIARYDLLRVRWTLSGLVINLVLLVLLAGGVAAATRKLHAAAHAAEPQDAAVQKLWGEWRTALLAGALLAVVATALMVFKPGI